MRSTLERLVRRPTSIALLETAVFFPTEFEYLRSRRKCLRCQLYELKSTRRFTTVGHPTPRTQKASNDSVTSGDEQATQRTEETYPSESVDFSVPKPRESIDMRGLSSIASRTSFRQSNNAQNPQAYVSDFFDIKNSGIEWQLDPERLDFESDVGHSRDIGSKLIDNPRLAHDFSLWKELLLHRQRYYGDDGVVTIWKGLLQRGDITDLPVEGIFADYLWRTFIAAGLRREDFLNDIHFYAHNLWHRTGRRWRGFYSAIVGEFVTKDVNKAVHWHETLKNIHLGAPNDIVCLFSRARTSEQGLNAFKRICEITSGHQIYSSTVPILWAHNRPRDALSMHKFLKNRGDGPKKATDLEPFIVYMVDFSFEREKEKILKKLINFGIYSQRKIQMENLRLTQASPSSSSSSSSSTKSAVSENHFSDEFGARLFATKTFTLEFLLAGLKVFSVQAIGPLSLREIALRSSSSEEIEEKLDLLRKEGISIGDSIFARLVEKLVSKRDDRVLYDLLYSDQHPDVLEDMSTQEKLLTYYYQTQDWRQVKRTLTILNEVNDEDPHLFNVRFRNYVRLRDQDAATLVIEQMRSHGLSPSSKSLELLHRMFIPRRAPGRRPAQGVGNEQRLMYLLGTMQHIVNCGGEVDPKSWDEGMKQLGMLGRWDDLQKLCFWLAEVYGYSKNNSSTKPNSEIPAQEREKSPRKLLNFSSKDLPPWHPWSPLRIIFHVKRQRAIIAWGFTLRPSRNKSLRNSSSPSPSFSGTTDEQQSTIPWVRGVTLLRQLRDRGVHVQSNTLRKACRQRLAVLFSEEASSNRPVNRMLRRENPWSLEKIVADIEKSWGEPLFEEWRYDLHKLVNPRIQQRS